MGASSSVSLMLRGQASRIGGPAVLGLRRSPPMAVGMLGPVSVGVQGGSDGMRERRCW